MNWIKGSKTIWQLQTGEGFGAQFYILCYFSSFKKLTYAFMIFRNKFWMAENESKFKVLYCEWKLAGSIFSLVVWLIRCVNAFGTYE